MSNHRVSWRSGDRVSGNASERKRAVSHGASGARDARRDSRQNGGVTARVPSDVNDAVGAGRILGEEEVHGDVVDGDAGDGLAFECTVMGVSVNDEVGPVAVNDFSKT